MFTTYKNGDLGDTRMVYVYVFYCVYPHRKRYTSEIYLHLDGCSHYEKQTGWWLTYPSEKYEFVSWDDEIPNIWKK